MVQFKDSWFLTAFNSFTLLKWKKKMRNLLFYPLIFLNPNSGKKKVAKYHNFRIAYFPLYDLQG